MSPLKHFRFVARRKLKPSQLEEVYRLLRQTYGCQHWWPGDTPFEVMIGAILTQNTAWTNVEKAILNLKKARKLTPCAMRRLEAGALSALIRPAGYYNVKAERLRHFVEFLFREYGGDPAVMKREDGNHLRNKLLSVKGIGPETADSILLYAADKIFFVIDAYTRRIFSRHRLYSHDADYHDWQRLFTSALPKSRALFNDFHAQIVYVGKNFCRARLPRCSECPLRIYLK